jgi:hypothetical protein
LYGFIFTFNPSHLFSLTLDIAPIVFGVAEVAAGDFDEA